LAGEGWPDGLTGTYVMAAAGAPLEFHARLPNGRYDVWLAGGKIIRPDSQSRRYLLRVNDRTLCDEEPS